MASQIYGNNGGPLPQMSANIDEKRPYQYDAVAEDDRLTKATTIDQHMKYKIRRLRLIQRTLNLLVSAVVLGIMLNTYLTFTSHRSINDPSTGNTIPIYPTDPITWPTFMMISTAVVSILFNTAIMTAYCWGGVGASNRVAQYSTYWTYFMSVVNLVVWLTTSTVFQNMKGAASEVPPPRDIYGWTCSDAVDNLASEFKLPVNFDLQCQTQQVSFAMGIINAGLEILAICINFYALRRLIHKKRMERMRRS